MAHGLTAHMSISNRFTRRFGLVHPFAGAGMGFVGMAPELAIAVSQAGGIGALGVGLMLKGPVILVFVGGTIAALALM